MDIEQNITTVGVDTIVNEDNMKDKVLRFIRKFPWFLFSWTFVLIFMFIYVDKYDYSYGCLDGMFYWKLMTYHMFHLDAQHIAFNIVAFWLFGLYINTVYNDLVNVLVYTIGVIVSGCTYYVDCYSQQSEQEIVGASGGVCAIAGAVLIISIWRLVKGFNELGEVHSTKEKIIHTVTNYALSFTSIYSVMSLVCFDIVMFFIEGNENTSHIAHFGGYISGFVSTLSVLIIINRIKKTC